MIRFFVGRRNVSVSLSLLLWTCALCVLAVSQVTKNYRQSFGEPRASIMENLLRAIYPTSAFAWSPQLMIEIAPGQLEKVKFPGFVLKQAGASGLWGATGIEIGDSKARSIFGSMKRGEDTNLSFPTNLAVFEATVRGQITGLKKLSLDRPGEVSEVKLLHLSDAGANKWPIIQVQYDSYVSSSASKIQIEWQASFDPNIEGPGLVGRIPTAVVIRSNNGREEMHILTTQRLDSSGVQVTDTLTGKTVRYSCKDPCLVDSQEFASLWMR